MQTGAKPAASAFRSVTRHHLATLAGWLLPFSWAAGLFWRWVPTFRFEWDDYLMMWECNDRQPRFWSRFGVGLALNVVVDAGLVMRVVPS
jgi:hypothetical protein